MRLVKALHFAAEKHKGQKRKISQLPYFIHPVIVSHLLTKYKPNSKHLEDLQIAALLHDTLEDTNCSYIEIERNFGPLVASLVMELTSDPVEIKRVGKNEYLKNKMCKMSKYAFILKIIDRFSNVLDAPTDKYKKDTLDLIKYLRKNRPDLTKRQEGIFKEIENVCK